MSSPSCFSAFDTELRRLRWSKIRWAGRRGQHQPVRTRRSDPRHQRPRHNWPARGRHCRPAAHGRRRPAHEAGVSRPAAGRRQQEQWPPPWSCGGCGRSYCPLGRSRSARADGAMPARSMSPKRCTRFGSCSRHSTRTPGQPAQSTATPTPRRHQTRTVMNSANPPTIRHARRRRPNRCASVVSQHRNRHRPPEPGAPRSGFEGAPRP